MNPGLIPFSGKPTLSNQKLITFQCHSIADGVHLIVFTGSIHQIKTIFCISILEVVLHGELFQVVVWLRKSISGAGKTGGEHDDPGDGYNFLSMFSTSSSPLGIGVPVITLSPSGEAIFSQECIQTDSMLLLL